MALNNINQIVEKGFEEDDENMYYDENINHMSDINVNNLIKGHQAQENIDNKNG
jgi:hypothetical protein